MPKGQPFTTLCQFVAEVSQPRVADLHVHTTASDGEYTPSQVVMHARKARLTAVAITDHDTCEGLDEARTAAQSLGHSAPEVIAGVEISTHLAGREWHILGLQIDPQSEELRELLSGIVARRRDRFAEYLTRLESHGITFERELVEAEIARTASLGRRHLANLLVRRGVVRGRYAAFQQHLIPVSHEVSTRHSVPADLAIRAIRAAGGVASLAHPPEDLSDSDCQDLILAGLQGVEVLFPAARYQHTGRLRRLAAEAQLVVTGGSDCHGPEPISRRIGMIGVSAAELSRLRCHAGPNG